MSYGDRYNNKSKEREGKRIAQTFLTQPEADAEREERIKAQNERIEKLKENPEYHDQEQFSQSRTRDNSANRRNSDESLDYSRMAEALNNQRYWRNTRAGTVGRQAGFLSGSPSGTYQMQLAQDTAEQRAQERAEGYEATQVGQEQERQDALYNLPYAQTTALMSDDMQRSRTLFEQNLQQLGIPTEKYNRIMELYDKDYAYANFATQLFAQGAVLPSQLTVKWNQLVTGLFTAAEGQSSNTVDQLNWIVQSLSPILSKLGSSAVGVSVDVLSSLLDSLWDKIKGLLGGK